MSKNERSEEEMEKEVERWKMKKLIKNLGEARGNGTSMITLMLTPKDQIALASAKLNEEFGTAANIKSHVNKLSVQTAISSTIQRLKLYNRVPDNGLVVFCGTVMMDNREKKVTLDFEPFMPVQRFMYYCDNKFHTEPLSAMLESDDKFGFIVMDGNGSLYGTVTGNKREILHKFTVELPKKHGRGGQSALRFARLRLERRHNYVRKVAELATHYFITNDRPNVTGLILAGSADFKNDLAASDMFDQRLTPIVLKIVDVAYGGENGFNEAVRHAADTLGNVRFVQEKKLINQLFDEISRDTCMYCTGLEDTWSALEQGAVDKLMIWEEAQFVRLSWKNPTDGTTGEYILTPKEAENPKYYTDPETGAKLETEQELFVEWVAEKYKKWGCSLEFVTNKSQEGSQFVRGLGGIGGVLRYRIDFVQMRHDADVAALEAQYEGDDKGSDSDDDKGGRMGNVYDDFDEDDFM